MADKIDYFEEFLIKAGVTIDSHFICGMGQASTDDLFIRYYEDKIEFAIKTDFDCWFNTADFILERLPSDLNGVKAAIEAVRDCIKKKIYKEGEIMNIYSYYRDKRKEMRNENCD